MTFSTEIKEAQPIIEEIYNDGFIQDLLKGDLDAQAVRQYLRADASYLKEFTNLYALLIPKAPSMKDVKFLVEQIEFMLDGEVEAHEILADYINEPYEEIVKEKYGHLVEIIILNICIITHMHMKMSYTIAMAPCPYVYEVVAKMALDDQNLNRDSVTSKWFDFYSTEMRPLIEVFDNLLDELTKKLYRTREKDIKESFLQSTIHERNFFNMAYINEQWNFGGDKMHKPKIALTIAGTDPSGGAGVMADLKSFHACGVYGMARLQVLLRKTRKAFNTSIILR